MTENKAIKWQEAFKKTYNEFPKEASEACDMAVSALEEIQEYRALGTVEEIKKIISFLSLDGETGLIDDVNLLNQYRMLGTVEKLREAREKQRAKKPKFVRIADRNIDHYLCGCCGIGLYYHKDKERKFMNNKFCPKCGQRIDWSEVEE